MKDFCYLTFYFQQIKRSKVSKAEKMLQIVPRLNRFLWHLSITSFITKSSFHLKVQRSPSAHKDHPHTCQLGLCVRSMFKVRQKRKRRRGHAGYLRRKIMREHLDTCPSRWSSCLRKQFLPSAWKTTAAVCHPSAPCFLPDTIHIFGFHSAPDFRVKGEMWSRIWKRSHGPHNPRW